MFSQSVTKNYGAKRRKIRSRSKDRRVFGETASGTRKENYNGNPMRGGIRL